MARIQIVAGIASAGLSAGIAQEANLAQAASSPHEINASTLPLNNTRLQSIGENSIRFSKTRHGIKHITQIIFAAPPIVGITSTFGPPAEGAGVTADQGYDNRPCIALRDDATLDRRFYVSVNTHTGGPHRAVFRQCDWGPNIDTGRTVDITGAAIEDLELNPWSYGNFTGSAREVKSINRYTIPRRKYRAGFAPKKLVAHMYG